MPHSADSSLAPPMRPLADASRAPREPLLSEFLASGEGRAAVAAGLRGFVEAAEAWRIRRALDDAGGNRSAAARALGIGRRTLYTKLTKLGLG